MILRALLIILSFFTFTISAHAGETPIATVIELEGAATRASATGQGPLTIDDAVYMNDTIETTAGSRALILFVDDTEITLGENSSLTVDEYIFDPADQGNAKGQFSVLKGSFLLVSGLISKNPTPDMKVKTSYGTIGLRGTTVWGGSLDGEYGVLVQEGEVDVINGGGVTRVTRGLGTFMKNDAEKPRPPKAWAEAKTARAVASVAMKRHDVIQAKRAEQRQQNVARRELRKSLQKAPLPVNEKKVSPDLDKYGKLRKSGDKLKTPGANKPTVKKEILKNRSKKD